VKVSEVLWSALQALRAHKLRSFLTLLGVIIGVTTIVAVVGVISGLNGFVEQGISQLAPDVYEVSRFGIINSFDEYIQALKRRPITYQEYRRLGSGMLRNSLQICARGDTQAPVSAGKQHLASVSINGRSGNWSNLYHEELTSGRHFTEADDVSAQHVAMIGSKIAKRLFPGLDPIGKDLLVKGIPFRIVGLYAEQGNGIGPNIPDQRVIIPLNVMRSNFLPPNAEIILYIQAAGGRAGVEASIDELRAVLRALRHTSFNAPDPFSIVSPEVLQAFWDNLTGSAFMLLTLMAGVSLAVGGIVIMNIMLVSVAERTQEIGIRRAIGARKRHIRLQFLLEAAMLSLLGGLIGVGIGWLITFTVSHAADFPARTTPLIVVISLSASAMVGIIAGFLPASRASNLIVIDAIRAE
jgi:putative ABC transport system permease protein